MRKQGERSVRSRHCMVVHAGYPLGETRVQRESLALVDGGFDVDVVCMKLGDEPSTGSEEGVSIYRVPLRRKRGQGYLRQLVEYLLFFALATLKVTTLHLRRRYDTIQVHNPPDFLVFATLIPKLMGSKVILDLHDLTPEFFAARSGSSMAAWPVRLVAWQERLACRFADHVITVTEHWKETLIARGVHPKKVSVVMNLADQRFFRADDPRPEGSGDGDGLRLIYHGTLTHRYGLDLVLKAIAEARREVPGVSLSLIGGGDARASLIEMAESLGIEDHVHFSSRSLHVSELAPLIRQADVAVVANRADIFTDGLLPAKMMEYVALGMPIIAARTTTINDYFDEDTVAFFEPENAHDLAVTITRLYRRREQLEQMAAKTAAMNEKYSWDEAARRYVATVASLGDSR